VASTIFYMVTAATTGTGQVSYTLIGAFLTLWGATEGAATLKQLKGGDK
jgi:hypothetical protein